MSCLAVHPVYYCHRLLFRLRNHQREYYPLCIGRHCCCQTSWSKPHLATVPYLIVVFRQLYSVNHDGSRKNHYYSDISVAISVGILLAAIQVTLIRIRRLFSLVEQTVITCRPYVE